MTKTNGLRAKVVDRAPEEPRPGAIGHLHSHLVHQVEHFPHGGPPLDLAIHRHQVDETARYANTISPENATRAPNANFITQNHANSLRKADALKVLHANTPHVKSSTPATSRSVSTKTKSDPPTPRKTGSKKKTKTKKEESKTNKH